MKLGLLVIIFFEVIIFLFGCSTINKQTDLLLPDNFAFESPTIVSKKEIDTDIKYLIHFLENGYGGRKYVPRDKMIDTIYKLNQISKSDENLKVDKLCEKIDEALLTIDDSHLMARNNWGACASLRKKQKEKIDVGHNIHQKENPPWLKSDFYIHKKRVSIIAISTLPSHEESMWNGFLEAVTDAKKSQGIIIDLRGNRGGDDTMGLALADYLYGQDHPSAIDYQIKRKTPETYAMLYNKHQSNLMKLRSKNVEVPDYLIKKRDEAKLKYELALKTYTEEEKILVRSGPSFDSKKGFKNPIFILTDRDCASSCESIVEAFEGHPHSVTVGTNTGGFCHFGNMGLVILPSSKITVQMATDYWVYKDRRFVEKVGYQPKIKLNAGQDAMLEAKKLMDQLLSNL